MKRLLASCGVVLAAALTLLPASPAAAAPRPSNPQGAAVSLAATTVAAGGTLRFTGTGWVNEGGRGQIVTVKLDDVDILTDVTASDSGAIAGSVTIPAGVSPGAEHWLRFLAGSGQENDNPARSLASGMFTVTAGSSGGGATPTATATPGAGSGSTASGTGTGTGTGSDLDTLPKTGIDAGPWLIGAIALPVAGIVLLLAERRRRQRAA